MAWIYDALGRLTEDTLLVWTVGNDTPVSHTDHFYFDLANNHVGEETTGGGTTSTLTAYVYNSDDQLLHETRTRTQVYQIDYGHYAGTTFIKGYDANGSRIEQNRTGFNAESDSYTWDLRGRMISATVNGVTASYTYDSNGVRVSETTGTKTTTYLNDPNNPTGYTKAVEENSTSTGLRSYVLGLKVEGQLDAAHGTLFLITDGHGNTRELVDLTTGTIQQHYDYDAYGKVLGVTGLHATYWTTWLFGGDGVYDPASGWTYQLARWRDGFLFPSMDSFGGDPNSPVSLHLYLYAGANPVNGSDPSGHFDLVETMVVGAILGAGFGALGSYAAHGSVHGIDVLKGAALGTIALPLAFASPIFGAGLAAFGLYQSWQLTWHVWENPQSSKGQLAASIILLGTSMFGTYAAGTNLAPNGWYNPSAFSNPPAATGAGLSSASALSELFEGVPDDAMVHVSRTPLATVASEGVKGSVGTVKSYWFRWGDVKHLTPTQYQSIVGPGAQGGLSDANVFVFKLVNNSNSGLFQLGARNGISQMQEYEASQTVMPDAGGVTAPNH